MKQRENYFIIPTNFKNGKYIFSKYKILDLLILILGSIAGLIFILFTISLGANVMSLTIAILGLIIGLTIIGISILLTINMNYYHNFLGKLLCIIRFKTKQKIYTFKGVNYKSYE